MSEYRATVKWQRESSDFTWESYNRDHTWVFNDAQEVPASAAPVYRGNPDLVDPEQAFVASLSSCHMLTFLALAAKQRFVVDEYVDDAVGMMEKNADGKAAITRVVLRPKITFADGAGPAADQLAGLHERAHGNCFIANSVLTDVTVEG